MKSYEQGRMDAWERIDAIKRRLGLAGFFNEQKIKRYPKGHPKAGEFMPKPKEGKKPVTARKVFNLNLFAKRGSIDGHSLELSFSNRGTAVGITFTVDGGVDFKKDLPSSTKKRLAIWWRRSAVESLAMMPDGVPLRAIVYSGDGRGDNRSDFYKALGFAVEDGEAKGVTRAGKISPLSTSEEKDQKRIKIKEGKGAKARQAMEERRRYAEANASDEEESRRVREQIRAMEERTRAELEAVERDMEARWGPIDRTPLPQRSPEEMERLRQEAEEQRRIFESRTR